jgi:hypothetical protein
VHLGTFINLPKRWGQGMFQRIVISLLCLSAGPWAWGQVACWGQKVTDGKVVYQKLNQFKNQLGVEQYQDQV